MRNSKVLIAALLCLALGACSTVPAGNVGIKVHLLGTSKGVDTEVLPVGRYWIGYNEQLFLYPTFTQTTTWTKERTQQSPTDESITFQTKEGMEVNVDIGITFRVVPEKAHLAFQKWRRQLPEIADEYLRSMVRDALVEIGGKHDVEYVYGVGKGPLMDQVEAVVKAQVAPFGIDIEKISWLGRMRLPQAVVDSINEKLKAVQFAQQRENEIQGTKAEAQKRIEEARGKAEAIRLEAEAQAHANKILSESITTTLVNYRALDKWDGVLPRMTGGVVPFINVDSQPATVVPQAKR